MPTATERNKNKAPLPAPPKLTVRKRMAAEAGVKAVKADRRGHGYQAERHLAQWHRHGGD